MAALFTFAANPIETVECVTSSRTCSSPLDLHITSAGDAIFDGAVIDLDSEKAWLFFDNIRPNDVISSYASKVLVNGEPMNVDVNCRVVIYEHGSVVMPYTAGIKPLIAYAEENFAGANASYTTDVYYCDNPDEEMPLSMVKPMPQDNTIRSFRLRRGYMVTFACGSDGLGYSRIFIADTADIEMASLPKELDHKISFIRVCKWQYTSKKGWAGSYWKEAPKGLQYVGEQCDLTRSTWYYNWGASAKATTNPARIDSSYNQEFVPEKWGAGGTWDEVYGVCNVSHLIGYNEPDHTEQSNVSVATAIEEWPRLMKTGLRLGSPATTSNDWLFEFMKEAKKRNYRVDFVVVHAYWGGLSGKEWYDKLKEIHETTGRPLWIKEWNNGANWTSEGWPSGTEAQQQKQLRDLKEILTVMDTTTFIERYSIYNWVEDKRAIILDGKLTPAGEYYAENNPGYFYDSSKEVIPTWSVREAPTLSYEGYSPNEGIHLSWTDYNGEQIGSYEMERSYGVGYDAVGDLDMPSCSFIDHPQWDCANGQIHYRLVQHPLKGTGKKSNVVDVNVIQNEKGRTSVSALLIKERWGLAKLTSDVSNPLFLLGPATYRNKMPLSPCLRNPLPDAVDVRLACYEYQQSPTLANPDTIALLVLPDDAKVKGLVCDYGKVDGIGEVWKTVSFSKQFVSTPVVFATQITDSSSMAKTVHIRNVTSKGFQISIKREEAAQDDDNVEEAVWIALSTGKGKIDDYAIQVGLTPDAAVGDNLSGGYTIETEQTGNMPFFFAQMQTCSDSIASTLRIKKRTAKSVTLIKDREKSASYGSVLPETVGWMALRPYSVVSAIQSPHNGTSKATAFDVLGRKIATPHGLCIVNGKKTIVRKH